MVRPRYRKTRKRKRKGKNRKVKRRMAALSEQRDTFGEFAAVNMDSIRKNRIMCSLVSQHARGTLDDNAVVKQMTLYEATFGGRASSLKNASLPRFKMHRFKMNASHGFSEHHWYVQWKLHFRGALIFEMGANEVFVSPRMNTFNAENDLCEIPVWNCFSIISGLCCWKVF